jgi:hypothetical protein
MHPCAAPHPSERPDRSYNCCASRARRQAHRRRRNCRVSHGSRPHEIRVLRLDLTLSVCTGALMLGKGGLLNGLAATTYHMAFEELKAVALNTVQRPDERWVDNGCIVASAASRQASTCRCTSSASCSARSGRRDGPLHGVGALARYAGVRIETRGERREPRKRVGRTSRLLMVREAGIRGDLAATFRSYMMLVSFLSGASTHLRPLASTLRARAG